MPRYACWLIKIILLLFTAKCGLDEHAPKNPAPASASQKAPTHGFVELALTVGSGDFKIDITGCTSGFSQTNISESPVQLYEGDHNCIATLKEINFNNKWWTNPSGCCASSDPIIFTNQDLPGEFLSVKKTGSISNPVIAGSTASFAFRHVKSGETEQLIDVGSANSYPSIQATPTPLWDPPNFSIRDGNKIWLNSIANDTKIATFTFQLTCGRELTNNTYCGSADRNQQHALANLRAKLVRDEWNSTPTREQLVNAISSNYTTPSTLSSDAPNFNGGIQVTLAGPGDVITNNGENRKMILIVELQNTAENDDDSSYYYVNIDFSVGFSLHMLQP